MKEKQGFEDNALSVKAALTLLPQQQIWTCVVANACIHSWNMHASISKFAAKQCCMFDFRLKFTHMIIA